MSARKKGEGGNDGEKKGKFILAGEREREWLRTLCPRILLPSFRSFYSTEVSKKYVDIFFGT